MPAHIKMLLKYIMFHQKGKSMRFSPAIHIHIHNSVIYGISDIDNVVQKQIVSLFTFNCKCPMYSAEVNLNALIEYCILFMYK